MKKTHVLLLACCIHIKKLHSEVGLDGSVYSTQVQAGLL